MGFWVDVRVPRDEFGRALKIICSGVPGPVTIDVDLELPAAGPEVQISVKSIAEDELVALLELAGIQRLALRTRPLEALEAVA